MGMGNVCKGNQFLPISFHFCRSFTWEYLCFLFFWDFLSLLRTYAISHSGDYRFPISFFYSLHVYILMKHVATGMLQRARDAHGVPTSLYTLTLLFITCLGMKLSLGLTFCWRCDSPLNARTPPPLPPPHIRKERDEGSGEANAIYIRGQRSWQEVKGEAL